MTLIPTDESQDRPKKYIWSKIKLKIWKYIWRYIWSKIKDLIRSTNNNSDEKYMKIKFNLNDNLPLKNKKIELYDMIIVVRSVFSEYSKYYLQVFLDNCLYKVVVSYTKV